MRSGIAKGCVQGSALFGNAFSLLNFSTWAVMSSSKHLVFALFFDMLAGCRAQQLVRLADGAIALGTPFGLCSGLCRQTSAVEHHVRPHRPPADCRSAGERVR